MGDVSVARPVFCIVDPSLRDFVGHHFAYDVSVAEAAEAAGFRAVALGPRDARPEVTARLPVTPVFRRDIWGKHPWSRPFPGVLKRVVDHALCIRDFDVDLRAGLDGLALPPGSVVLGHMITAKHLPGLARAAARLPPGVTLVLLLRYQPFFYDNPIGDRAFRRLEALARQGRRIRLASDSARLAREIGRLTTLPVEVLPIPHTPPETDSPGARRDGAPVRFASLGGARDEKGYLEILEAIRVLRAEPKGLAGLEFVLQSNDAAPDVQAAIDAFAAACPPQVTLLRSALYEAAYAAALHAADVVLLPYWRSIYEARTSGVFLEALAAGKPVIATDDTWMSDELARHGAGILVPDRNPAALAAAIRAAAHEHAGLAAR
ncbi:MAG: glycosyltransferase, partial [Acetobacteraceae bacterium]|nr:glycosyltransferase [Acetobacteraceae bacterium]